MRSFTDHLGIAENALSFPRVEMRHAVGALVGEKHCCVLFRLRLQQPDSLLANVDVVTEDTAGLAHPGCLVLHKIEYRRRVVEIIRIRLLDEFAHPFGIDRMVIDSPLYLQLPDPDRRVPAHLVGEDDHRSRWRQRLAGYCRSLVIRIKSEPHLPHL
ncbi:hypothetical protein [Rhizobium ruizarguesonis]|uniref:hypothetical protein n=1 Tax=Rhizobium ruizarguesonis TaxID=2081791 RepID=UPI0013EEA05D|nr:hypothetical protein [Rhizobium ruizarguesonis]